MVENGITADWIAATLPSGWKIGLHMRLINFHGGRVSTVAIRAADFDRVDRVHMTHVSVTLNATQAFGHGRLARLMQHIHLPQIRRDRVRSIVSHTQTPGQCPGIASCRRNVGLILFIGERFVSKPCVVTSQSRQRHFVIRRRL